MLSVKCVQPPAMITRKSFLNISCFRDSIFIDLSSAALEYVLLRTPREYCPYTLYRLPYTHFLSCRSCLNNYHFQILVTRRRADTRPAPTGIWLYFRSFDGRTHRFAPTDLRPLWFYPLAICLLSSVALRF